LAAPALEGLMAAKFASVEEYINSFSEEVQQRLERIRRIAHEALPDARDRISYGIAAVTLGGRDVVFYSGWKRHVALYPVPGGDEALVRALDPYRAGKGTLQFRLDHPLPEELVRQVVTALAKARAGSDL
jgi:uncharacterized protein YdhG (YjbR/CyaY superfamily)